MFQPGDHASTYGGNPFVCAVALAVCQTLEREHLLANVQARGEQLRAGLAQLAVKYPHQIAEVRGWGLINGLELQAESSINAIDIVKVAMQLGLLLVPAGAKVVRFVPPLIVSAVEIDRAVSIIDRVLAEI